MEDGHQAELRAYYSRGEERDRLAAGGGQLEFLRTTEILMRRPRRCCSDRCTTCASEPTGFGR
jgi:hypothetical protein